LLQDLQEVAPLTKIAAGFKIWNLANVKIVYGHLQLIRFGNI